MGNYGVGIALNRGIMVNEDLSQVDLNISGAEGFGTCQIIAAATNLTWAYGYRDCRLTRLMQAIEIGQATEYHGNL